MNRIVELTPNQNTLTANYRAGDIILVKCDATTSAFSVKIPDATSVRDIIIYIKKTDSSANAVTLTFQDSQTCDGATSVTVNSQYDSVGLISDYSNYHKIDFFVDEGDYLLRDGSRELTDDWDAGSYKITTADILVTPGDIIVDTGYVDTKAYYYINGTKIISIDGSNKFFAGRLAGDGNSGQDIVAMGTEALSGGNTAAAIFALGRSALKHNIVGTQLVAIGVSAMEFNNASWNVAIADGALRYNVNGTLITAIGKSALGFSASGIGDMVAIGAYSLFRNSIGYRHSAVGVGTGQWQQTGQGNCWFGYDSGKGSAYYNASYTTASGFRSAFGIATGADYNAIYGAYGGYTLGGAARCCYFGAYAGQYETGSGKLFIDSYSRTNEATARISSLIYGEFSTTVANQLFRVNGKVELYQVKSGDTQGNAGAIVGEVWKTSSHATLPDNVLMIGV